MITALVPGSFDPPTKGHLDVVERCASLFDEVVVSVVHNPSKTPLFTAQERVELLEACCAAWPNVRVASFEGLLVDFAREVGAKTVVKGLRAVTDFEFEIQMSQMNRHLSGDVVSLFVATKPEYGYLSSSLVKEVARLGGSVDALVPEPVAAALKERLE
ncbi:MAG: pantetheine-phosphate adenylyltransferase [Acidimicrobiia bacterium]|nr:MAG: pantetheine-phosphate adenylyltransferase [Acidimicrobiia bacterium]